MSALITASELPKWVPGKVLSASDDLGWNGVGLRSYRYAPSDVEVPAMRASSSCHTGVVPPEWSAGLTVPGRVPNACLATSHC